MEYEKICPLCERDMDDHDKIYISGDEAYACYGKDNDQETNKQKLIDWIQRHDYNRVILPESDTDDIRYKDSMHDNLF